jgi:hypothetical protein
VRWSLSKFDSDVRCGKRGRSQLERKQREDENAPFSDVKHVYDPETLKIMGAAFDNAWQSLPPDLKDHERARRKLALLILRHMDRGEPDANLSDLALLDFLR